MFDEFEDILYSTASTPQFIRVVKPILVKRCPICGFKFDDFRESGDYFLGCSKCYEYFRDELTPYIDKIAGGKR